MAASEKGIIGKQVEQYYEDEDNKPGLMERTLSDVLIGAANFLIKSFGMKDVTLLVFGKNPESTSDGFLQGGTEDLRSSLYLGVFSEGMMNAIDAIYTALERFIPYPIFIALILIAFLLLWHGYTGEGRTKAKDYATAFVVGLISLRFGVYLWNFIATIVSWFTDLIWAVMVDYGLQPGLFLNTIWGTGEAGYDNMVSYRGFIVSILVLLAALMTAKLNYDYTIRSINLMLLIITFVPCCIMTLFPRYRNALQTWWDQFVANMILPLAHALALGLFFLLLHFSSEGISNWVIVAYLFGFSSIQNLVQRLLGVEQPDSRAGRALGFGTILAMSKMFSGKKSNSVNNGKTSASKDQLVGENSSSDAIGGMPGDATSAGTRGTVSGTSSSSAMSGKPNFRNKATNISKKVAGFALNQGAKGAGAVLGASIGFMAGDPLKGAVIGGAAGGLIGKGTQKIGQGSMWLGKKAYSGVQKLNGLSATPPASDEEDGSVMSSVPFYEEKPVQSSTTGTTEQPFRSKARSGSGVLNEGVVINGGRFDGDVMSINTDKEKKTQGKSDIVNGTHINRGVKINGGNFKGNIISDGGEVTITGGVMDANKIKNANGETIYSPRESNSPSSSSSPTSGGKHYNYHV
ncbi:hypothetical protein [Paenibacillus sp. GM2]|uniref:hypothetical protein n=1 Tax=Paenibacillus sp. GM2 TaxID=1622070 RepID=UPI001E592C3B|nr:hypothetical protein [Paenibacillus sp. GM2]